MPKAPASPLGVAPREGPRRSTRPSTNPDWYTPAFSGTAINPDTGSHAEYKELSRSTNGPRWTLAMCKEMGRLFQGFQCPQPEHTVQGTDTCQFIHKTDLPPGKKPTYVRIVSDYREHKADPYRVRCTVGGNLIDFPGDKSTRVADLVTVKCLINNVISTPGARAACIDIKDFYLNNPLPNAEYVRFLAETIPTAIWDQYNLQNYVDKHGHIYAKVDKGMYGLPQAGKVASDFLLPRLKAAGYEETGVTPGLFKHTTNSILFALVVDDFFVQYTNPADLDHLQATLRQHYTITVDMAASKFCGMTLDWNYEEGHVTISMPGYIEKALQRFTHPDPTRPQHSPHPWIAPEYGASIQYAAPDDTSAPLNKEGLTRLLQIIGTFLYYGRAVDNTMLVALGTLAAAQSQGTERTMEATVQLLNYAATHPDAAVRFYKSDMILYIHSDASYLSEPKARSRVGGYFYLGKQAEPADNPHPNGPIHVESRIMKNVMAAASEAEIGALFHNGQEGAHIRQVLKEIGREQIEPTRLTTDNSTADGFANKRTKIKRSKAMDMRFYWIQDRVQDGQFQVHWLQGEHNHADYFTKHHPPSHHSKMRPIYLHTSNLAQVITPACRGVLILDPGLAEPRDPESLDSQLDDSWRASMLARRVSWAVTEEQPTSSPISNPVGNSSS
jgi:Reverse transcriptase (RNA-dependent DNA polymerase)